MIGFAVLSSCSKSAESDGKRETLFTTLSPEETGISFTNTVTDSAEYNIFTYRNFYNGGGVGIGDVNNDGLADLYFTANTAGNKLFLNLGNWKFKDITDSAHVKSTKSWSTGVAMADVNGDGWLDIYVCNSGDVKGGNRENELFINNGDLTFTERAQEYGLADKGYSTHASFFDMDRDGDLDCYLLNNSFKTIDRVDQFYVTRDVRDEAGGDKLFRNDNSHFVDVSEQANIYGSEIGFGLGISVSDLNGDMLPDLYVSNDFWERDYLYINKSDGTFSEDLINRTGIISASSMGSDVADLDNDGDAEIFTTEMLPGDNVRLKTMTRFDETNIKELKVRSSYHYQQMQNCIQWNYGDGNFQELASLLNVDATDWSWGSLLFDMNNDGRKDIFVANGIYRDITSMDFSDFVADRDNIKKIVQEKGKFDFNDLLDIVPSSKIPNYAFLNTGNKSFSTAADSLGLGEPSFSNGAAYGDLDNDGDLDLVVNNLNMPAFLYRNNSKRNYLKVKLHGAEHNPFGIGAKVFVYTSEGMQVLENFTSRGFQSSIEPQLLFGLDSVAQIDSVVVIWPNLKKQTVQGIKSNETVTLSQKDANKNFVAAKSRKTSLFHEVTAEVLKGNYKHTENDFNDFDRERLLPKKLSAEGPKIITGDVNRDGLQDFLLLGATGDADKLFLQTKDGKFEESKQQAFLSDLAYESTCGTFFDLDKDGDVDLLIGSGGNEPERPRNLYQLRYYQNDGKGKFKKVETLLTQITGNFSSILAEDFDRDGDEDLFLGRRVVPGNYGLIPGSFLIRNDGSTWTTITTQSLANAGMVTDALWADVDNDSLKDLIVVGEWMPVMVHRNSGTTLEAATPLPGTDGWWTSIAAEDLNKDGKVDFVLGNWGLNSRFRASSSRPMEMHVNDFDQNGKSEFIITYFPPLESRDFPFASKHDVTSQMPFLKKRVLKYSEYARFSYNDLFTSEQRKNASNLKVTTLQSSILLNAGNGKFRFAPLPLEAQVSPVFSIVTGDFNDDDHPDILLCGNFSGLKHEVARQDANRGVVLVGDGKGTFSSLPPDASGLFIRGEVRDAKVVTDARGKTTLLVGRNNDTMQAFRQ
jgi:hypothetical protein